MLFYKNIRFKISKIYVDNIKYDFEITNALQKNDGSMRRALVNNESKQMYVVNLYPIDDRKNHPIYEVETVNLTDEDINKINNLIIQENSTDYFKKWVIKFDNKTIYVDELPLLVEEALKW